MFGLGDPVHGIKQNELHQLPHGCEEDEKQKSADKKFHGEVVVFGIPLEFDPLENEPLVEHR